MRVLLVIAAIVVPIAAVYAQPAKIGVLTFEQASESLKQAFPAALRAQGYAEGKNVVIEWRSADGKVERANQIAAEFVQMKVNVIVASLTPSVQAARNATTTIPIVMAPAGDPLAAGFVASLAHPGGNITGVTNSIVDVGGKLLGLIREIQPNVSRVAVLLDERTPLSKPFLDDVQAAAAKSRVRILPVTMKANDDAAEAFKLMQKEKAQAVVVLPLVPRRNIAELARVHRSMSISTGVASRSFARAGGLVGYGVDANDLYGRAAVYVAKILRGARPAEMPVEQLTTFELTINAKTAKALGVTIPKDMLVRANEVIE